MTGRTFFLVPKQFRRRKFSCESYIVEYGLSADEPKRNVCACGLSKREHRANRKKKGGGRPAGSGGVVTAGAPAANRK
ncbi:hypothetical protein OUZ56_006653 [Daphnia magna]|uniref:Uncharacterized protein n=1 Tax=Daphnia magna TaxID=35525 RepID=A0ABQ9YWB4_9CRUS|nr:hypothetical protein OUZ56_006653 [Daphnia magna]